MDAAKIGQDRDEAKLTADLTSAEFYGDPVKALLKTNERVFARITDGIYREPASALRELIANAYDADATEVRIFTDAPNFSKIVVRDNGHGLDEKTIAHVICNIGGSLKRTSGGAQYDVTSQDDRNLSPGKRRLIGKLGIGLFSVSQITHHIVIVSKVKGSKRRLVCDILLRPQSEVVIPGDSEEEFITGEAALSFVPADDVDKSGTEITLLNVRPFVRESLQSKLLWGAIQAERKRLESEDLEDDLGSDDDIAETPKAPNYHIGEINPENPELLSTPACLPWSNGDSETAKFRKLYDCVRAIKPDSKRGNVKLSDSLDSYLRMLWSISLSVPLPYIDKHPYLITSEDGVDVFAVSNQLGKHAEQITLASGQTVEDYFGLKSRELDSKIPFRVVIDGVELRRPVSFDSLISDVKPLLFIGKASPSLSSVPEDYRGGDLEFESYTLWTPKIAPTEHNGVLVRIHGANGTLYDSSFLGYQVSEQTRLRQLTGEVFAVKGLDASLNIDRESFNISHPHYQFLKKWLHNSLRQLMTRHKSLTKGKSDTAYKERLEEVKVALHDVVADFSKSTSREALPVAFFSSRKGDEVSLFDDPAALRIDRDLIFPSKPPSTTTEKLRNQLYEEKLSSVAKILNSYGVLSDLPEDEVRALILAIAKIFLVDIKK